MFLCLMHCMDICGNFVHILRHCATLKRIFVYSDYKSRDVRQYGAAEWGVQEVGD